MKNAARLAETNFRAVLANDEHREPFAPDTMATAQVRERIPSLEDAYEVTRCLVRESTPGDKIKTNLDVSVNSVGKILRQIGPVLDEFDQGRYGASKVISLIEPLKELAREAKDKAAAAAMQASSSAIVAAKARGANASTISDPINPRAVEAVIELADLACQLVEMTEKLVPRS